MYLRLVSDFQVLRKEIKNKLMCRINIRALYHRRYVVYVRSSFLRARLSKLELKKCLVVTSEYLHRRHIFIAKVITGEKQQSNRVV
jgi:hypothetical protein